MFNIRSIIKKAKSMNKTIVFPEAFYSERTQRAIVRLLKEKVVNVIVLGDADKLKQDGINLKGATVINPMNSDLRPEFIDKICEIRQSKGMTKPEAEKLLDDYLYFGTMLVLMGYADGMIAGAENPTSNVLRPALQLIKTKPNIRTASSCFMMVGTEKLSFGENNVLFVADCALNVNPDAETLSDIALSTASTAKNLAGIDPKVAMLSYSSFGSAKEDEDIVKIRSAIKIIKNGNSSLKVDGEMQLDCALIPSVAKLKAPESKIAGKANILIFPDLNSGNIGYKIMQRFSSLKAIGVIIQGLNKPVNDLSRGCSAQDIYVMSAITAIQSE